MAHNKDVKNPASLDSMISFWDRIMQPDVAAFYTEKKAEIAKADHATSKPADHATSKPAAVKETKTETKTEVKTEKKEEHKAH